ncbi:uncharacterized protein LOC141641316 [Silene latifolia]|uniref:uncharacterized protein LOC141641316 n=1 Tax=Silene latifolia TaxID=37657 RepID=UPI003D77B75B
MGIIQANLCFLCGNGDETLDHILFQCAFSSRFLCLTTTWLRMTIPETHIIESWIKYKHRSLLVKKVIAAVLSALVYQVWMCRNQSRLEEVVPTPAVIIKRVKEELNMRFRCNSVHSNVRGAHQWFDQICIS